VGKEVAEKKKDKDDITDRPVRCRPSTSRLPTYPNSAVSKRWIKIENQSQSQSGNKIKSRTTLGRRIALIVSPETFDRRVFQEAKLEPGAELERTQFERPCKLIPCKLIQLSHRSSVRRAAP